MKTTTQNLFTKIVLIVFCMFIPLFGLSQSDCNAINEELETLLNALQYKEAMALIKAKGSLCEDASDIDIARYLSHHANAYVGLGNFSKSLELSLEIDRLYVEKIGIDHEEYCTHKSNMAQIHLGLGQNEQAESYARNALVCAEENWGRDTLVYGIRLHTLGSLYLRINQLDSAKYYLNLSKKTIEATEGKNNKRYVITISSLGNLYLIDGNYFLAERYLTEARELGAIDSVMGVNSPQYAMVNIMLASYYSTTGKNKRAVDLLNEVEESINAGLPKSHPDYVQYLAVLSSCYISLGQHTKALEFAEEARKLAKELNYPDSHPVVIIALNGLAAAYSNMGEPTTALMHANELYTILTSDSTKSIALNDAISLMNLGNIYQSLGQPMRAIEIIKGVLPEIKGLKIIEAVSLANLAGMHIKIEELQKADSLFTQADLIMENISVDEHGILGNIKLGRASIPYYQDNFSTALELAQEAKQIIVDSTEERSFNHIAVNQLLALIYDKQKNYAKASEHYTQALSFSKEFFGEKTLSYAGIIHQYVESKVMENSEADVYDLLKEANELVLGYLQKDIRFLSDNGKLRHYSDLSADVKKLYKYGYKLRKKYPEIGGRILDTSMSLKGLLLESAKNSLQSILLEGDSTLKAQLQRYLQNRQMIANHLSTPAKGGSGEAKLLKRETEDLEQELMLKSAVLQEFLEIPGWKDVRSNLKSDEILIDFYFFREEEGDSMYYATILHKDFPYPITEYLGDGKQLRDVLSCSDEIKNIYAYRTHADTPNLYTFIWKPIERYIPEHAKIYCSPAGLLHTVAFSAIETPDKLRLIDKYYIEHIGSARELGFQRLNSSDTLARAKALIIGDIDYQVDPELVPKEPCFAAGATRDHLPVAPNISPTDSSVINLDPIGNGVKGVKGVIPEVRSAKEEIEGISEIMIRKQWETILLDQQKANETCFKEILKSNKDIDVIHIITHGIFFRLIDGNTYYRSPLSLERNPLFRSILLFAGAQRAWSGKFVSKKYDDGILTAYEAAGFDLSGTKLVVLSACETGLGDIYGSEGVYGLQRAFKLTGAEHVMISLWPIQDGDKSVDFMETFYENLIAKKMEIHDAFYTTQKAMKEKHKDPYYWAGFILI